MRSPRCAGATSPAPPPPSRRTASVPASSAATGSTSAAGTARWIICHSAASVPSTTRPSRIISRRALLTDPPGQEPGGAAVGGEPAVDERRPEPRVGGGDGEVGGEREVEADARGPPAYRAHHRHLHRAEQRDESVRLRREPALDAADAGLALLLVAGDEVEAGAEVLAVAGEQDGADRFVAPGEIDRVDRRVHHRVVDARCASPAATAAA